MKRINLYVDEHLWATFRIACLMREISASHQASLLFVQWLHEQECQGKTSTEVDESAYNGH